MYKKLKFELKSLSNTWAACLEELSADKLPQSIFIPVGCDDTDFDLSECAPAIWDAIVTSADDERIHFEGGVGPHGVGDIKGSIQRQFVDTAYLFWFDIFSDQEYDDVVAILRKHDIKWTEEG